MIVRYELNVTPDIHTFGWYNSLTYYLYHASLTHKVRVDGMVYSFKYEDVKVGEWRDVLTMHVDGNPESGFEWHFIIPEEWQEWEPKTSKMSEEQFVKSFREFVNEFGPIKIGVADSND